MTLIRRAVAKAKRLHLVFNDANSEMQVQIARICVLYEDLRIEGSGLVEDSLPPFDRVSAEYRRLYFIRRAVATLHEMSGAIHKLNSDREFKMLKRGFDKKRLRRWQQSIRTLASIHAAMGGERNLYGGHFHDEAGRFALAHLTMDHVGMLVIEFKTTAGTYNSVFKFASDLAAIAFTAHRGNAEVLSHVRQTIERIRDAMENIAVAVQILDETFIQPRFGV